MLKPFIPTLVVVALAGASVGAGPSTPGADKSVWRWQVSTILDAQRNADATAMLAIDAFTQGQPYPAVGVRAPDQGGRR